MRKATFFTTASLALMVAGCGSDTQVQQYGENPELPGKQRGLFPTMTIAAPAAWGTIAPSFQRASKSNRSPPISRSPGRLSSCRMATSLSPKGRAAATPR
ncbi:hypothetical protein ACFOHN_20805 [Novosphingobium panipatense]|uniref:hypothetical protein n=1 Tax=Novosphingobium panipatense TaxID=428991 RepID=UPI003608B653